MPTGELLANGFGLFTTGFNDIGGGVNRTTVFPTWKDTNFIFSFDISALGLSPSTPASVELKSVVVKDGNRTSGGVITDRVFTGLTTWNGTTNAQGDLSMPGSIESFAGQQFWGLILSVGRDLGAPNQSFQVCSPSSPHPPLPESEHYAKIATSIAENVQTLQVDSMAGEVTAICLRLTCVFTFELRDNGVFVNETEVEAIVTSCINLGGDDPGNPSVTYPFTILADGINKTISTVPLNTTLDRAVIPYNKTTEREVVHLDYRVKNGEVTQPTINSIIVPYITDEPECFKISSAGGTTFSITSAVDNGDGTTTLTTSSDLAGTYHAGLEYSMRYQLGNIVIKPGNGDGKTRSTNRATKDTLSTMTFAYSDASVFNVEISAPKRDVRLAKFVSNQIGYSSVGETDLRTGEFRFHVRGKTRDTNITVTDNSVFPLQLQHIEIERNVTSRSKR